MTIHHKGKERLVHFVSGHIDLTEHEFNEHYKDKIYRAAAMGHYFIVGDAAGCDTMAQRFINNLTPYMSIYHMLERPRNRFGAMNGLVGGFASDEERDSAMTEASDVDIAWVRNRCTCCFKGSMLRHESQVCKKKIRSGTAKNLQRRKDKLLRIHLEERATWERVHVRESMDDDGIDRFVIVDQHDSEYYPANHLDVPIPPGLKDRFTQVTRELRAAESSYFVVQQELRRAVDDKLHHKD